MVEDMELKMRNQLQEVYFGKGESPWGKHTRPESHTNELYSQGRRGGSEM